MKNARHHDLDGDVGGDDMQSRYSATYGSLGAVIVLLLWFYMSGPSILMSAEINSVLENAAADASEPDANMKVRRHHIKRPQQQREPTPKRKSPLNSSSISSAKQLLNLSGVSST